MNTTFDSKTKITPLAVGEREAAKMIGVSARTLWEWRRRGTGPHHRKVGGRVLYPIDGLKQFLNEGTDAGHRQDGSNE